jgi:regulator of sigma E protease
LGKWLARNASTLLIVAIFLALLYYGMFHGKSLPDMGRTAYSIFLVILGLGFVIFIHELGHFLAAKACDVRVEAFSIGFGPAIPGCRFRYGETEYKIALFPIGGYVKMPGEYPTEAATDEVANDPRAFMNKTVGQRMIIISAGVIMNVILGLICFIYAYQNGKPEIAPALGPIEPGSPADIAGVQAGSALLQINDNSKPVYEDLFFAAMFATPGETPVYVRWRTPAGEEKEGNVIPRKLPTDPKPVMGVGFPDGLTLLRTDKPGMSPGYPGTPVARAEFRGGDRLIAVRPTGAEAFTPLTVGWDLAKAEYAFRGRRLDFRVLRNGHEVTVSGVEPRYFHTFGFHLRMGGIATIGKDAPASVTQQLQVGDRIIGVDGNKEFDPMRLPDLITDQAGRAVKLLVEREGKEREIEVIPLTGRGTWNEEQPLSPVAPVSIPALGITFDVIPTIERVVPSSPATNAQLAGGEAFALKPGDAIKEIKFQLSAGSLRLPLDASKWPRAFWLLQSIENKTAELKIERAGETRTVLLTAQEENKANPWPLPDRGFFLEREIKTMYAEGVGEAIGLGFRDTHRTIGRIYLNLKGLLTRDVSPELLSGPIAIVRMTYGMAERGLPELILFLGMISINLAVVNFLPIPILDGGHMLFLIVEKIRGGPASERALIIANSIGLLLLGCLMVFVVFLDVSRLEAVRRWFSG